jgi:hypothetical protein
MFDNSKKTRVDDMASTVICNCALHIFHPIHPAQLRTMCLIILAEKKYKKIRFCA